MNGSKQKNDNKAKKLKVCLFVQTLDNEQE